MYPALQAQVKESSVSVQVADTWQSWEFAVHSSISVKNVKSYKLNSKCHLIKVASFCLKLILRCLRWKVVLHFNILQSFHYVVLTFVRKKGLRVSKLLQWKDLQYFQKYFLEWWCHSTQKWCRQVFFFFFFWAAAIFDPPSWISWLLHNVRKPKMCESDIERKINITARKEILGKITRFGVQG